MRIVIASDHGGFELKQFLKQYLTDKYNEIEIIDIGTDSEESVNYSEYGIKAAELVRDNKADKGIIICGTGIGISIAANKVKGIRAALCHNIDYARLSREHNNSNMLALGGRFIDFDMAKKILNIWLNTEFEGGRHNNRINYISEYESGKK
jgi:ribose 5-phosphate isomerase B